VPPAAESPSPCVPFGVAYPTGKHVFNLSSAHCARQLRVAVTWQPVRPRVACVAPAVLGYPPGGYPRRRGTPGGAGDGGRELLARGGPAGDAHAAHGLDGRRGPVRRARGAVRGRSPDVQVPQRVGYPRASPLPRPPGTLGTAFFITITTEPRFCCYYNGTAFLITIATEPRRCRDDVVQSTPPTVHCSHTDSTPRLRRVSCVRIGTIVSSPAKCLVSGARL
jgi:hypothetical protein